MTTDKADSRRRALLIEDDDGVRRSLQLLLHWRGYDVLSFASAAPVLTGGGFDAADVLIADYRLPDATGCDVRRAMAARGWQGRSVLITGAPSAALAAIARDSGFDMVLGKPLRQQALFAALGARE
ncbi:response regulator [Sphingomonas fuzhouensis]|uniref:response regulator n=1 Tax=Sphingomonas fuzhouensis TaxID=3106033 RepID=UPI002AFF3DAC|nr:response regulator [Sphingomonas sp. SGZ-02]